MQFTDTERQLVYARLEGRMKDVAQELGIRNPQRVWRAVLGRKGLRPNTAQRSPLWLPVKIPAHNATG